mmetsp:Transcript_20496/g.52016  ORF Transcript_20496/g.52016 Transcript_20496/m.52016 type:complete len:258 (-) Transcript_20496:406-1179(-)
MVTSVDTFSTFGNPRDRTNWYGLLSHWEYCTVIGLSAEHAVCRRRGPPRRRPAVTDGIETSDGRPAEGSDPGSTLPTVTASPRPATRCAGWPIATPSARASATTFTVSTTSTAKSRFSSWSPSATVCDKEPITVTMDWAVSGVIPVDVCLATPTIFPISTFALVSDSFGSCDPCESISVASVLHVFCTSSLVPACRPTADSSALNESPAVLALGAELWTAALTTLRIWSGSLVTSTTLSWLATSSSLIGVAGRSTVT